MVGVIPLDGVKHQKINRYGSILWELLNKQKASDKYKKRKIEFNLKLL